MKNIYELFDEVAQISQGLSAVCRTISRPQDNVGPALDQVDERLRALREDVFRQTHAMRPLTSGEQDELNAISGGSSLAERMGVARGHVGGHGG